MRPVRGLRAGSVLAVAGLCVIVGAGCVAPPEAPQTTIDPNECEAARDTVETAAEAYRATTGAYPSSVAPLVGLFLDEDRPLYYDLYVADGELVLFSISACPEPTDL